MKANANNHAVELKKKKKKKKKKKRKNMHAALHFTVTHLVKTSQLSS